MMFYFAHRARTPALSLIFVAYLFVGARRADAQSGREVVSDARLAQPLDRQVVLEASIQRNPAARVFEQRARAMRFAAKADGGLPAPEVMGQVWQVPFAHPTQLDAQMIMVGVSQSFPAPGVLSAREQATAAQASGEEATAKDKARVILEAAGHAFSDYQESSAKHRLHRAHLEITTHIVEVAAARHAAGGSLIDVTRAEVELSRVEADVVTDRALVEGARFHINALLARSPGAPLGAPLETEPTVPSWDLAAMLAKAREARPEFEQALAEREARGYAVKAAEREATWPAVSLGALYFPPTTAMPFHGYGATLSMSVPWLWGASAHRRDAERELAGAASSQLDATRFAVDAEVVTAQAKTESAARRLLVLSGRTLLATRRAFDAAQAGYESGRSDLMTVLDARRSVVDVEHDVVMTRSELEHALTDLEAAVGTQIPMKSLSQLAAIDDKPMHGADHVR